MGKKTKIGALTNSETLVIWRRREGLSRGAAAAKLGLGPKVYIESEQGIRKPKRMTLGHLKHHERCFIVRTRQGLTQEEVADKIGVSRYWVNLMENGKRDCARLMEFFNL